MAEAQLNDEKPSRIIIKGVTENGQKFRPSDWAERMSGSLCTFRNHRIHYSPLLRPSMIDGFKCVLVDARLEEKNPELYEYIIKFAEKNHLVISYEQT